MRDIFQVLSRWLPWRPPRRHWLPSGGLLLGVLAGILAGRSLRRFREIKEPGWRPTPETGELGAWEWFPQTGVVYYSARWGEILGYTPEEIESNFAFFIRHLHPDDRPAVLDRLTPCIEGRTHAYQSEHRMRTKEGTWKWVLDQGRVVEWDPSGRALRVTGFDVDISGREVVVEALEKRRVSLARPVESTSGLRFQDLFDLDEIQRIQDAFSKATGVASIITDTNGRPITQPSNFCRLCTLIRGTPQGLINCFHSDATLGRLNPKGPIIAPCLSGGLFDGGASICAGDDHIANWLIGQVRDESISDERLMEYAREIGADKVKYREALREVPHMSVERFKQVGEVLFLIAGQLSKLALRNLQQTRVINELEQAQADLRKAKEIAEAASHAKDQFIGVLSHELRTPLTAVLGAAATLYDEEALPAGLGEYVELIQRNVALEARLIDDLLDVTRISRGKLEMNISAMDVHACLRSALEICETDAEAKNQRVALRLEAARHHVMGDPARLQQVFWNLLKNAIKFTPGGGRISVRTFNAADCIKVVVADTGIGLEPGDIPRIFKAFEQIGGTFGGLGLGLSIAKAVVELHHGRLTCTSPGRDQGASFTVELDCVPAPAATPAAAAPSPGPSRERAWKVLVVEDHRDTLRILTRMLSKWGYAVTPAETMQAALEEAGKETFDVLVSDLGLPDGSGLELIRRLRLPGIALSGYGTENDLRQSREAGFAEHLVKPVGLDALRKALEQVTARLPVLAS